MRQPEEQDDEGDGSDDNGGGGGDGGGGGSGNGEDDDEPSKDPSSIYVWLDVLALPQQYHGACALPLSRWCRGNATQYLGARVQCCRCVSGWICCGIAAAVSWCVCIAFIKVVVVAIPHNTWVHVCSVADVCLAGCAGIAAAVSWCVCIAFIKAVVVAIPHNTWVHVCSVADVCLAGSPVALPQ
eukprot:1161070-Pelagomonas_calceolata.AAC.4